MRNPFFRLILHETRLVLDSPGVFVLQQDAMQAHVRFVTNSLMTILIGLSVGCGKQETATTQVSATPAASLPGNWLTALPAKFAGLTIKDDGACYLDAINGTPVGGAPVVVKSGVPTSIIGWAAPDQTAGRLGSAL